MPDSGCGIQDSEEGSRELALLALLILRGPFFRCFLWWSFFAGFVEGFPGFKVLAGFSLAAAVVVASGLLWQLPRSQAHYQPLRLLPRLSSACLWPACRLPRQPGLSSQRRLLLPDHAGVAAAAAAGAARTASGILGFRSAIAVCHRASSMNTSRAILGYSGSCGVIRSSVISGSGMRFCTCSPLSEEVLNLLRYRLLAGRHREKQDHLGTRG